LEKPALVIIAGGIGSRYGGMKQMDPVDNEGHFIIDFSIYDAVKAGFSKVVCVVAPGMEQEFRDTVGKRSENHVETLYAVQYPDALPPGFALPEGRKKPWGTAHAVMSAKRYIDGPFAVINADDFYGSGAYSAIYDFLCNRAGKCRYAMVGYRLDNTLSEHGHVSRGVCETDAGGKLVSVTERKRIVKRPGGAAYTENGKDYVFLPGDTTVSMSLWGFGPDFMNEAEKRFALFLSENLEANPLLCEYYLPDVPNAMLSEGIADITVLRTDEKWMGVTYSEDMPFVRGEVKRLKAEGKYPEKLWDKLD
jgi:NDP-sugar pyrophosphorylase family protein